MHRRYVCAAACVAVYTMLAAGQVTAQQPGKPPKGQPPKGQPPVKGQPTPQEPVGPPPATINNLLDSIPLSLIPDSVKQEHMVHVSPHLIVFDPSNRSTTLEFSNQGSRPTEADVEIQYGFTYWQNEDTAIVPLHGLRERGHDTVIYNPGPRDRSAVKWLSGVPTHIVLGPHEKRQVTLQINPPANIPNGEYYARIVTLVGAHAPRSAVSQDIKQSLRYPVKGWELPIIRDSARVFYRQGPQSMGLKLVHVKAKLDPSELPPTDDEIDVGTHPLQVMAQLQLTGTTHFEGIVRMSYVSENGDEMQLTAADGGTFVMHKDGIVRFVAETDHLPMGHTYHFRLRFFATQDEFAPGQRLAMAPVDFEAPMDIPMQSTRSPAVSTGQDMYAGNVDPYWYYIQGMVNYGSANALNLSGSPAIVDTTYNYSDRQLWPWAMRTLRPSSNLNGGWVHPTREAWRASKVGGNTLRSFIVLPGTDNGVVAPLTGVVWSDGKLMNILVNGKQLPTFNPNQPASFKPAKDGYPFRITMQDGLQAGPNIIDYVWEMKDPPRNDGVNSLFAPWYVIRVDFNMVFREMHNK